MIWHYISKIEYHVVLTERKLLCLDLEMINSLFTLSLF